MRDRCWETARAHHARNRSRPAAPPFPARSHATSARSRRCRFGICACAIALGARTSAIPVFDGRRLAKPTPQGKLRCPSGEGTRTFQNVGQQQDRSRLADLSPGGARTGPVAKATSRLIPKPQCAGVPISERNDHANSVGIAARRRRRLVYIDARAIGEGLVGNRTARARRC